MIRELRHVALVLAFRVPLIRPLVCPRCGRARRSLSRGQYHFWRLCGYVRCGRDMQRMQPANHPSDHISRAAAYYGDGGQS